MDFDSIITFEIKFIRLMKFFIKIIYLQRNSVSPAEREKYRPRSPPEIEDAKRRKEDKLTNVSSPKLFSLLY